MPRVIGAFAQFLDGEGYPLTEGLLQFTVSGTNATDKDTYADADETIPNTNPVVLDAEGRCPNVFGSGAYRVTVFTSEGEQISQKDPVANAEESGSFPDWNSVTTYNVPDIVIADDLLMYRSITNANQGNDPTISEENWEQIEFNQYYNQYRVYGLYEHCIDSDTGLEYISQSSDNIGNEPSESQESWLLASGLFVATEDLEDDYVFESPQATKIILNLNPGDEDRNVDPGVLGFLDGCELEVINTGPFVDTPSYQNLVVNSSGQKEVIVGPGDRQSLLYIADFNIWV